MEYEEIRRYLYCRLLSTKYAKGFLEELPSCPAFADMVLAAGVLQRKADGTQGAALITKQQTAAWGITEAQLLADARENMYRMLPPRLYSMEALMCSDQKGSVKQVIRKLLQDKYPDAAREMLQKVASELAQKAGRRFEQAGGLKPMWVLSNAFWFYGSFGLTDTRILSDFAKKQGCSFYILPASVHEVILLPEGGKETRGLLYDMVASANGRMQDRRKLLSDEVYYFDRCTEKIVSL